MPSMKASASETLGFASREVALRAEVLLREHRESLYRRTDRLFAGLMGLQWLAGLMAAYWIAPRSWEGLSSRTHPHVWAAIFLGGLISLFPITLALWYPGRALTRHVIAVGQLLMSGLLIHLTGGRSETHFHIFGSLAFLAFYRDWRVLITASLVTALDHGLRGLLWPQSIFGVAMVEPWRWVEHSGWVVFTDTFLIVSIRQSVREMRGIAGRQATQEAAEADLQQAHERLELRVQERTVELAQANAALENDIAKRRRVEEALRENEQRLRMALESGRLGSYEIDLTTGRPSDISDICRAQFGLPLETEASTADFFQAVHPDDRARVQEAFQRAVSGPQDYEAEFRYLWPDGSVHWISVHGSPICSEADKRPRMIGITQDITERKRAEEKLQQERDFISAVIDTVGSLVMVLDRHGRVVRFNRACEQTTGYSFAEVKNQKILDWVLAPEEAAAVQAVVEEVHSGQFPNAHENDWVTRDGARRLIAWTNTALLDTEGAVEYVIGTGTDITERRALEAEREQALREAMERADRDPLTGLLNHRAFHKRLEEETAHAAHTGTTFAVVTLDLDNFKFFNEVYGHAVGDEVLRLVTQRLQSVCRPSDTVARFGGDEFALLLLGVGPSQAAEVEASLRADLDDLTFRSDKPNGPGMAIPITLSVGAALFAQDCQDRQEVLRQADERLRRAKTGGELESEARQVRASALRRVQGFSLLDALVTAVDNKDRYTCKHSEEVMVYSLMIARQLGLDEAAQQTVAVAALLHDVGKIGVPDAILRKPGKLTEEEFEAIKQHPMMGAIIVQAVPGLEGTLDAVRHHHERWDGAGYPFGLAGEETPLIARLMAVADAFSAMTMDRPYRKGMDRTKALSILEAGAGTQWDAVCVAAFLKAATMGLATQISPSPAFSPAEQYR